MLERRKEGGVVGVTSRWGFESILVLVTHHWSQPPLSIHTQDRLPPCYRVNIMSPVLFSFQEGGSGAGVLFLHNDILSF